MKELVLSGDLILIALIFMLVESLGLFWWWRWKKRGLNPSQIIRLMLPGAALFLALHAALGLQSWSLVLLWISLALVFHLYDLKSRWTGV
ncbi:hypothetical protein JCM17846_19130 [Iodidimonas nitroreducens]|uniref:DUF2568 domain-containing protein n=1 Tax=Iodidimonas nitroreducens TaxID=1236968 RepID=A0A5A7N7E8_9PROT|nr:hypothetical protein [Iodidimonas nitroreducens]GAK32645.1 hypothetical protein AQ1_00512 [alpha proteobacterium Q-1]GER04231.1 hypothetical protein JCM17846_19130 [Iodidimonas nitroreducens]